MNWQPISTAKEFENVLTLHEDDLFPVVAFRVGDMWLRVVEGPEDVIDRPGMMDELYQTPTWWLSLDDLPDPPARMTDTCSTCRWWKFWRVVRWGDELDDMGGLGYCEPKSAATFGSLQWKGLTAEDYSCGEHKEKPDG